MDRYNHLAVLEKKGELICLFYVTTDDVAAWLPDGTCLGPRRLIGSEPTPGAAKRIAAVLRAAELRARGFAMTIQVPFQLRRGAAALPAAALFFPPANSLALFAACEYLGLDPSGRVFDVAGATWFGSIAHHSSGAGRDSSP